MGNKGSEKGDSIPALKRAFVLGMQARKDPDSTTDPHTYFYKTISKKENVELFKDVPKEEAFEIFLHGLNP